MTNGTPALERTASGLLAGTPAFMAPEQLRSGEVSALSDQFAFAVVLYRAIYGQAPFAGDDLPSLRKSVLAGALRPPPRRPELPAWLWPVLSRALSGDPGSRFASMTALLAAIGEHLPRDPQDDPQRTQRGRTRALLGFFGCTLVLSLLAQRAGPRLFLGTHARVAAIAAGLLAVATVLCTLLWRSLTSTPHGRRSVALLLGLPLVLLGHRLLAWQLGIAVPSLLATDSFLLASLFACSAVLFDRWLAIPAALYFIASGASAYHASLGAPLFPLVGPGSVAFILWRTLRR